jgi:hypothetical protein
MHIANGVRSFVLLLMNGDDTLCVSAVRLCEIQSIGIV